MSKHRLSEFLCDRVNPNDNKIIVVRRKILTFLARQRFFLLCSTRPVIRFVNVDRNANAISIRVSAKTPRQNASARKVNFVNKTESPCWHSYLLRDNLYDIERDFCLMPV